MNGTATKIAMTPMTANGSDAGAIRNPHSEPGTIARIRKAAFSRLCSGLGHSQWWRSPMYQRTM